MAEVLDGASPAPSVSRSPRIPLATHINYSIGTMAPSALIVFSRSFLLFFYSQVVGLDPWLAGIALTVGRVWDAISDPVISASRTSRIVPIPVASLKGGRPVSSSYRVAPRA